MFCNSDTLNRHITQLRVPIKGKGKKVELKRRRERESLT